MFINVCFSSRFKVVIYLPESTSIASDSTNKIDNVSIKHVSIIYMNLQCSINIIDKLDCFAFLKICFNNMDMSSRKRRSIIYSVKLICSSTYLLSYAVASWYIRVIYDLLLYSWNILRLKQTYIISILINRLRYNFT